MEQHSYRECVELSLDSHREELENSVVRAFEIAAVNVEKRNFHAIHRLGNSNIVIAKLLNRRNAIKILQNKKNLRELSRRRKQELTDEKIYVNESLCYNNKRLLGKCNLSSKKSKLNLSAQLMVK